MTLQRGKMVNTVLSDKSLYDEDPGIDDLVFGGIVNPDLTDALKEQAAILEPIRRGLLVVSGPVGSGKGLISYNIMYKCKHFFPGLKVWLDERPRRLFGPYIPYSAARLLVEYRKMGAEGTEYLYEKIDDMMVQKVEDENKILRSWGIDTDACLLENAIMYFSEFWKHFYRRRPHRPEGEHIRPLFRFWRHLDLWIIGNAPKVNELDVKGCMQHITAEMRTTWVLGEPHTAIGTIYPAKYTTGSTVLDIAGKPIPIKVNGNTPVDMLGGKRWYDIYNSKNKMNIGSIKQLRG